MRRVLVSAKYEEQVNVVTAEICQSVDLYGKFGLF